MENIVILGASGFLGSELLKKLDENKFQLKSLYHKRKIDSKFNSVKGSILSQSSLNSLISNNDIVINLTGQFSKNFEDFFQVNLNGTMNLLNVIKNKKNVKLIHISSIDVYGNKNSFSKESDKPSPSSIYATTKLLTEQLCEKFSKENNLDVTLLRFSNIYGPHKKNGIITNLLNSKESDKPINLTHKGKQIRDFLFIDDAIDGIIQAIDKFKPGFRIFNISSGKKTSVLEIIKEMKKNNLILNYKITSSTPDDFCICANNSKSKNSLSFKPKMKFKDGLKFIIENS